jgi:hypothetical protein
MQNGCEIGASTTAGIEDTDGGAGEAEWLIEFGAKKMVYAFDHVSDDFFWGVPDSEFLAKIGVEGLQEGLVKVGDRFIFAKVFKERRLNPVEGITGKVENLLKLDGIQCSRVRYFAEELSEDWDAKVVGGNAPVETGAGRAGFGGATPQNPGRENTVKESLDESRAEKVLAFVTLELDAE